MNKFDQIILVDDNHWEQLLPLTYTKPISELRVGILTIKEKWEKLFNLPVSVITKPYLAEKFPLQIKESNLLINSCFIPSLDLYKEVCQLEEGESIYNDNTFVAFSINKTQALEFSMNKLTDFPKKELLFDYRTLEYSWDIFSYNTEAIEFDFELITKNRESAPISKSNNIFGDFPVFAEEGAQIEFVTINATNGPVYIGKNAQIMEGSFIRGPLAICDEAVVKMGAKIYGGTTIGPKCKVGGEINNSVFQANSNKAHDGYLGNAVIGEWCNLGAGTNNSNLKNNYAEVKMWAYPNKRFIKTGLQFCGLIMADHSKCGISTMFNTGTVIGVSANIFGSGYPRNFIPSFSWGGAHGFQEYKTNKAFEVCEIVMKRRNLEFNETEEKILDKVFELSSVYRK